MYVVLCVVYIAICVIWLFAIFGVPLLIVMAVVWLLGLPSARRARRQEPRDTRMIQHIHRGLARMENRLESVETLMFEKDYSPYARR